MQLVELNTIKLADVPGIQNYCTKKKYSHKFLTSFPGTTQSLTAKFTLYEYLYPYLLNHIWKLVVPIISKLHHQKVSGTLTQFCYNH